MDGHLSSGWRPLRDTVALLDVDPELGRGLDPADLPAARERVLARLASVPPGRRAGTWGPPGVRNELGLLIVDGLAIREIDVAGGGVAAELLGPPDVIRPWDDERALAGPLAAEVVWTVLGELRVAVLDESFVRRAGNWPPLLAALAASGVRRAQSVAVHQAISHLKRVDQRLLLLLWHLADRWGRVGRGQILLDLPLTHEILARLVGARRPSVTTALGILREQGLVERREDGVWLLDRSAGERLRAA